MSAHAGEIAPHAEAQRTPAIERAIDVEHNLTYAVPVGRPERRHWIEMQRSLAKGLSRGVTKGQQQEQRRAATLARSRCRLPPSDAAWIGWGGRRQIVSVVSFYC